jgi:hypothetical protein
MTKIARKTSPKLTEGYEVIALPHVVKAKLDAMRRPRETYYELLIRLIIEHEELISSGEHANP